MEALELTTSVLTVAVVAVLLEAGVDVNARARSYAMFSPLHFAATEGDVRPGIEDMTFEGWVDAAGEAASKAGINSTPSVFVDGEKIEGEGLTIADIAQRMVG